ncbi:6,7-dimethyl-8-ribityllumazine synthase [Limisphaera sp. 4302-co]|uniref:6,7-dimethyl-8-ribityllumazine synthase n=1 Tax=Limisphaera sp. 4302-co TaxID=3400417 RepID=UPI003C2024B3
MLRKVRTSHVRDLAGRFAIVASRYNGRYVNSMVRAARRALEEAGAQVELVRVPGAYEIPLATELLARRALAKTGAAPVAILCLGVILRGETVHAAHIGEAVSRALMEIQLRHGIPVIHEVLLLENREQAVKRCLDPRHNRGLEAAHTALEMARLVQRLRSGGS